MPPDHAAKHLLILGSQLIEQTWKQKGPFNSVIGFSQGAILISALLAKAVQEDFCVKPESAILFGQS